MIQVLEVGFQTIDDNGGQLFIDDNCGAGIIASPLFFKRELRKFH